jgi:hypothetical protein
MCVHACNMVIDGKLFMYSCLSMTANGWVRRGEETPVDVPAVAFASHAKGEKRG